VGTVVKQLKATARDAFAMAIKAQVLVDQMGLEEGPFDGVITSYAIAIHDKIEEAIPLLKEASASDEGDKRIYEDRLETFYNHVARLQIRPDGSYDRHRVEVLIRTAEILAGVAGVSETTIRAASDRHRTGGSDSE
jgi:hypothetical protein